MLSSFPAGVAGSQCACPTISAYNPDRSVVSTEGGGGKREHAQSHHPVIPPLSRSPFVPSFRHLLSPTFLPFFSLPFPSPMRDRNNFSRAMSLRFAHHRCICFLQESVSGNIKSVSSFLFFLMQLSFLLRLLTLITNGVHNKSVLYVYFFFTLLYWRSLRFVKIFAISLL